MDIAGKKFAVIGANGVLGGHMVAFLHPRSTGGVLTELVEDH